MEPYHEYHMLLFLEGEHGHEEDSISAICGSHLIHFIHIKKCAVV
jgi:hypothetical protein